MLCFKEKKRKEKKRKEKKERKKERKKEGKKDGKSRWTKTKKEKKRILNPPSLARAVFNPNKKAKKDKKRENIKKKEIGEKEFFTCCASPAVH